MASFLGVGSGVWFGNTVRASTQLLTNLIDPLNPLEPLVINGDIQGDSLKVNSNSTVVGKNTGPLSLNSTFIGANTGQSITTGLNNTFLGTTSGVSNTTGSNNILIGPSAGNAITTGNNNTIIGASAALGADPDIDGCILIGTTVGQGNTSDNRLMIDNSSTNEPLLDGDFSANTLQVNGVATLGQDNNISNVHVVNGLIAGSVSIPDPADGYLVLHINGADRWIPFFNNDPNP
jgi:hypothetical protein